jgi:hypothetical protein
MNGYIRNKGMWRHALKRNISPGQKIELDELYEEYGKKNGLSPDRQFVDWLKNVKLKDHDIWEVVYKPSEEEKNKHLDEVETESENNVKVTKIDNKNVTPFVEIKLDDRDIVNMSVREAKKKLDDIDDVRLLKMALRLASTQAGKETLTNMLRKRIEMLEDFSGR